VVARKLAQRNNERQRDQLYQGMVIAPNQEKANDILKMWVDNNLDDYARAKVFHTGVEKGLRQQTMNKFKKRKIQVLIVVQMLREGFDHPPISVIGIPRNITSPILFTQFIGRSFRIIRGNDRTPDVRYIQTADIITAEEFKQQSNWDKFWSEELIDSDDAQA